jgi:hypothetical protein
MSVGSCDNRITLYPAAPLRLATLLHTRTIAREGMGLIFTTADWRGQICDGFRQPHIRPAQRPHEGASELLAYYLAFRVIGELRIAPCGTRPSST